jgi:hypothetical protein
MTAAGSNLATYDYSDLDGDTADRLRKSAVQIRAKQHLLGKTIIEIGTLLLDAKRRLPHGQFGPWIRSELSWNERSCRNYMAAAEAFAGSKTETVADLPATTIYRLASPKTPPAVRDHVVQRLEQGEVVTIDSINAMLVPPPKSLADLDAERRRRRARRHGGLTPKTEKNIERRRQKEREEADRREAEIERDVQDAVDILTAHLPADDLARLLDLLKKPAVVWRLPEHLRARQ